MRLTRLGLRRRDFLAVLAHHTGFRSNVGLPLLGLMLGPMLCLILGLMQGPVSAAVPTQNPASLSPAAQLTPPPVDITGLYDRQVLNGSVGVLMDSENLDFDQIRSRTDLGWEIPPREKINYGQSTAAFWFHFTLTGLNALPEVSYLRLNYPHLDQIEIYVLSNDGTLVQQLHTGDTTPFDTRPILNRIYLLPINADWGKQVEIYLRVASEGPIEVPLDVITRSAQDRTDKALFAWYGAFFGITLAMLFYNAFIFLVVRDISYFYYIVYVATTMALQFTLEGLGFEYLWPRSTTLNNTMVVLLTGMMPFSAVTFIARFVDLDTIGAHYERLALRTMYVAFSLVLIGVFTLSYHTILAIEYGMATLAIALGFFIGFKYSIRGFKAARFFTTAWLVYLLFIGDFLLDITGLKQPDLVSRHALEIGSLLELMLLSLAFADRINSEKELRLAAQKAKLDMQFELNQELDQLVHARTQQLEATNLRLREISVTDGLTGVHNRRHFSAVFDQEYRTAFRDRKCIAVLMIDVDHFKSLNDQYGHQAGDVCLTQVAEIIKNSVRRPADVIARYGGEEFIAVLPRTRLTEACRIAEAIRNNVANAVIVHNGITVKVTVSIGVAVATPATEDGGENLIKQADEQLYRAKSQGRNRVQAKPPELAIAELESRSTRPGAANPSPSASSAPATTAPPVDRLIAPR